MKRFIISSTILLALVTLAVYSIMSWWGPAYQWRQKLTVTVETPEGLKSGSAVTEVKVYRNRIFKDGAEWQSALTGEAVVVDLGSGKFLFAVLGTDDDPELMEKLAQKINFGVNVPRTGAKMYQKIETARGLLEVPPALYPTFVIFENLSDPASVKLLPAAQSEELLGKGTRISSVVLDFSNTVETNSIRVHDVLSWLSEFPEPPLCQPKSGLDFSICASKLHHGDFYRR